MQDEPQLSAEIEKRFDQRFNVVRYEQDGMLHHGFSNTTKTPNAKEIKHFLATALEEQRMQTEVKTGLNAFGVTMEEIAKARADEREKVLSEVDGWLDEMPIYMETDGYSGDKPSFAPFRAELRAKLNQLKGEK